MVEFVYKESEFQLSVLDFDIFITFTSLNRNIARSARTLRTARLSLSCRSLTPSMPSVSLCVRVCICPCVCMCLYVSVQS